MAQTGILQRRDIKANLIANPPIDGEIVYATDTDEHGFVNNGTLYWKKFDMLQPIVTVSAPPTGLENDPIGTVYLVVSTITNIAISPVNPDMDTNGGVATPIQFTATATYGDGSTSDVTTDVSWTSSDTNVVTINNSGLAEFVYVQIYSGVITITASMNGLTDTTTINLWYPAYK